MKLRDLPRAVADGVRLLRHKLWGDPVEWFDDGGFVDGDDMLADSEDPFEEALRRGQFEHQRHDAQPERHSPMEVAFGGVPGLVYAGPYRDLVDGDAPDDALMICMAAELQHLPHDVLVPTRDFGTPDRVLMENALRRAIQAIAEGQPVAVGCKGGIGRTGLFLALLAKVMYAEGNILESPLEHVREAYYARAVETAAQVQYLHTFNVARLVEVSTRLVGIAHCEQV